MSSGTITKTILIDGMTCTSCENRIERTLSSYPGIESASVSYSRGTARITYHPEMVSMEKIEEVIKEIGYDVKKPEQRIETKVDIYQFITVAATLISLLILINRFGILRIFKAFPVAREDMGYGMLLMIGLLTSVHCVAMCGGICLSQCLPQKGKEAINKKSALRPSILYNLGRVISYTVIGGIVGAIGSMVSFTGTMKGIIPLIAGIFMVIMGLNMMNVFPWLRKINPRMPKIVSKKLNSQKDSRRPFFIGLLNGLMPCGPLQAMQLYALSTGNPINGALSMFLFSIGTVPLMFTFGAISSILTKKFTRNMMRVSAVLVIGLGVFMFQNGSALLGLSLPEIGSPSSQQSKIAKIEDGYQIVSTDLASGSYEPITIQKGIPVKWIINAKEGIINGCNNSIIIPKYNMQIDLKPGENLIEFTPMESGELPYSCWMGMLRSKIYVVDNLS